MTSDNQGIEVGVQVVITGPDAFGEAIAIGRSGEVTHIFGNSPDCKVMVKGATFRASFPRSSLELVTNKSDNQGGVPNLLKQWVLPLEAVDALTDWRVKGSDGQGSILVELEQDEAEFLADLLNAVYLPGGMKDVVAKAEADARHWKIIAEEFEAERDQWLKTAK